MASDVVEGTGGPVRDSGEVPISANMLTSIDDQHTISGLQYSTGLSASDTIEVSQDIDQNIMDSCNAVTDTMEAALPSSNSLALEGFGTPSFRWDEVDFINGHWQFTPQVR